MESRLRGYARSGRLPRVLDLALILALIGEAWLEIWVGSPAANGWGGPRGAATALAVLVAAPLWWRVSRPYTALIAVLIVTLVLTGLVQPAPPALEPFLALTVCCYSVGVHVSGRRTYLLIPLFVGVATALAVSGVQATGNSLPVAVWASVAWLIGRVIRSLRARTRDLEDVTAQLVDERAEGARAAVLTERTRIARELHDVVAHNVSVMVVQATAASRRLEGQQTEVRAALSAIEQVGRETVDEMRRSLGILRQDDDTALSPPPSLAHLDGLLEQVRAAGLSVNVDVEGTPPSALPGGVDLSAYRIVQEALTNTLKHAHASTAFVCLRYRPQGIELDITDDGQPSPNGNPTHTGHGLVGMRERAALYGGSVDAAPDPSGGYHVHAILRFEALDT